MFCHDATVSQSSTAPKALIFDWDDTICPSSFVDRWQIDNIHELPLHFQRMFSELAKCAERCLEEASRYGEVIIITNSDDGWVKFSAERFVPNLLPVIEKYPIVSARTRYERFYPNQPLCWKAAAFAHEVNEFFESAPVDCSIATKVTASPTSTSASTSSGFFDKSCDSLESTDVSSVESTLSANSDIGSSSSSVEVMMEDVEDNEEENQQQREIISFGDSMEERTAVLIVSRQLSATPKSVMFLQSPNPIQLIGQLQMLTSHMKYICERQSSLDLEITPDQADRYASRYMKRNHCEYFPEMIIIDPAETEMATIEESQSTEAVVPELPPTGDVVVSATTK